MFQKATLSNSAFQAAMLEKSIMQKVNHPNVMHINDDFEDESNILFVMDFKVDDLRNLVKELEAPLNEYFARQIF